MNVLFVLSKKNWGGVNTWATSVINHLAQNGHKVTLVTSRRSPALPIVSSVKQRRISFGFDFNPVAPIYFLALILSQKIDLVMANVEKDIMSVGLACKLLKIPLIRRIGREQDFNPKSRKTKFIHQTFVTHGFCTSKAVADATYRRCDWIKTEIKFVYSGIESKEIAPDEIAALRQALKLDKNDRVLGITARLSQEKRIDFLIEVFAPLLRERNNIKLVIAGKGGEEEKLRKIAEDRGVNKSVIFAGYTDRPLLFAALYDICYLPTAYESFPFSVIEYMAAGKPTIASNVGGIPEGITDGENGFLIEPNDGEKLLSYTIKLLDDEKLRKIMGENARKRFLERHSAAQMTKNVEAYFLSILKR
ncbi:MAG: glycosyltransferase family 4 protein [Helicobacteraceae bacterium]|jgi:glycosyltransferase involved in cell wall biosynthesis|nr:glycosyltransferase family 4 protein [Helicobacteraceae bacterium]